MKVELELLGHPKYLLLKRAVGPLALEYLLRLWGHCSTNKRGERWAGATSEYVETVCNWGGVPGKLFHSLVATRLIEAAESGITVHGWDEANSFLVKNWTRNPSGGPWATPRTPAEPHSGPPSVTPRAALLNDQDDQNDKSESEGQLALTSPAIPTEAEFQGAFSASGIPPAYLHRQFEQLHETHCWVTKHNRLVDWRRVVQNRWVSDRHNWVPEKKPPAAPGPVRTGADVRADIMAAINGGAA
jgi:hypothetical protein